MGKCFNKDILIVGAGPVGLFSVFQAGLLGMSSIVIDALSTVGGQLSALYPLKHIYDIPGYSSILAKDLVDKLVDQATKYNPEFLLGQKALHMCKSANGFSVTTSLGNEINAKAIVIAGGAGAFGPNRLDIKGLSDLENKSVFYNIGDPIMFKDKTVVIAGGGDSAVDWTLILCKNIAKKVYLVHRRDRFRAMPDSVKALSDMVNQGTLELCTFCKPVGITSSNNELTSVIIESLDGIKRELNSNFLLPFFGLRRDLGGLDNWGLNVDKVHSTIFVSPSSYETNIPGIYAVGDMATYDRKLKLIMVGFSEVAYAIHHAWQYVFPETPFRFIHSTSRP